MVSSGEAFALSKTPFRPESQGYFWIHKPRVGGSNPPATTKDKRLKERDLRKGPDVFGPSFFGLPDRRFPFRFHFPLDFWSKSGDYF